MSLSTEGAGHEQGDVVPLERGDGEPMLLVGDGTPAADVNRLVERLESVGYGVHLEYASESQRAYLIDHPGFGGEGRGE